MADRSLNMWVGISRRGTGWSRTYCESERDSPSSIVIIGYGHAAGAVSTEGLDQSLRRSSSRVSAIDHMEGLAALSVSPVYVSWLVLVESLYALTISALSRVLFRI